MEIFSVFIFYFALAITREVSAVHSLVFSIVSSFKKVKSQFNYLIGRSHFEEYVYKSILRRFSSHKKDTLFSLYFMFLKDEIN